jgi:hypothetical protein
MLVEIQENLKNIGLEIDTMICIEPNKLNSRKKLEIYDVTTIKNVVLNIFVIKQASRFIRKNANDLISLLEKLEEFTNKKYNKNILFINAPLCSKARAFLQESNWIVFHDTL